MKMLMTKRKKAGGTIWNGSERKRQRMLRDEGVWMLLGVVRWKLRLLDKDVWRAWDGKRVVRSR
jgi:hypothetical protein